MPETVNGTVTRAVKDTAKEAIPLPSLDDPSLYINRELSWLEFNRRVLEEARDPRVPLLDRLKFLAIFGSNLDEFFMVRVGGLQQKMHAGIALGSGADQMPPREQLERIRQIVRQTIGEVHTCLTNEIMPALEKDGIVVRGPKDLTEADRKHLAEVFRREVYPVLTPLGIDPTHPFPHLLNKSLNMAVLLRRPAHAEKLFAVVQVPSVLPRFLALPAERGHVFTALETVIRLHMSELFPGLELESSTVFRVTRDSEYEIDDDEVEDLLKAIEEEIRKRRRGVAVRLEIEVDAPPEVVGFLTDALDLDAVDVFQIPGMLDLTGLFQIHGLPGYSQLRDPAFTPQPVPEFLQATSLWAAIRARDILVHHPYESFSHVLDFIEQAAADERVLAIKQTLYRTSSDSPIVRALQRAADNGKQVTALIELKARLDEERNIHWSRELEKSGVHVVYGFVGLKTHCKVALVVRREDDGIRRYVHLATGNYNPQTARIYTDFGLFTCNSDFCEDVSALFNYLTGYCELPQWRKLIVAPQPASVVHDRADRAGNRLAEKREGRADHHQDQRPFGTGGGSGTVPGEPGGSEDRHHMPRNLRSPAATTRDKRQHSGVFHRGSFSGTQPVVLLRQLRRSPGLHWLRRLDGPQSQPPRRSGLPHRDARTQAASDP